MKRIRAGIIRRSICLLLCMILLIPVLPTAYADDAALRIQLANEILSKTDIKPWTTNDGKDKANAKQNLIDTADGKKALRSSYGNAPGGSVYLSVNLLRAILDLEAAYGEVRISMLCGGSHSKNSAHYSGVAADLTYVGGGISVSKGKDIYRYLVSRGYTLKTTYSASDKGVWEDTHYHVHITGYSLASNPPVNSDIPVNAMEYNGHTYELYNYHLSWTDAEAFCEARGGHLVSITDAAEQAAVVNLMSGCTLGWYHIGGIDPGQTGAWSWINGEGFSYSNWDPQTPEPNQGSGVYYTAIIGRNFAPNKQIGEWIDSPNNGTSGFYSLYNGGFICEYDNNSGISYTPANTLTYNGKIYERYDYHMSWTSARALCEQLGGHLVSITNEAEQQAVVNLLSGCTLGYYHIGASTPTPGYSGWSWVNGESFTYSNWDPEAPEPSATSTEFYSAIIGVGNGKKKQTGEWIDEPDNGGEDYYALSNSGFICEYDADTTPPTISDVSVTDVSPTGYTVTCRVSDDTGVARVSFPTWPLNGGQPLWKDGTILNGTATFRVNVSDHNGVNGCTYVTHIYAYDDAGNVSSVGDGEYSVLLVSVPAPDTTPPTISDVTVTDVSPTGYTVTCKVSDDKGVARVAFPTWTLNNDQDDIIWSDGELEGNTATYRVEVGDHNGENGCTYRTHIYAYDLAGNHSVASVDTEVPVPKFYLNLDGLLDGETSSSIAEYGTADVYINGALVASGWSDYWEAWPTGTTYEIKNIKAADGRRYNGVYSGSLSGTVGTEQTNVVLSFSNIYTFTFDADGGTGSMPDMQTAINDPVVLPNCGFTKDVCLFQGWEAYRPADNKYAISDVGWRTEEEMTAAGLTPTKYPAGLSFDFNTSWTEGTTGPVTIVLRPVWLAPDFVLPTSLREIEDEAFEGAAFSFVKLPVGTASIGSRAFANCSNLTHIYIPASATSIDPTAFAGTSGLTIHGTDGSYAEFYAGKYGFAFIPVA